MYHSVRNFELALNMDHTLLIDTTSIATQSSTTLSEEQYYKYQKRIAPLEQSLQKDVFLRLFLTSPLQGGVPQTEV